MSHKLMDDQMKLSKFQRNLFFKHQAIGPQSIIPKRGEDSSKSTQFPPLIIHISHDGSGFEQVDPLKNPL